MSAFIERVTGGQVGGATERSIHLGLSFIRLGPVIILLLPVLAITLLRSRVPAGGEHLERRRTDLGPCRRETAGHAAWRRGLRGF
jgi:hypothetical protein